MLNFIYAKVSIMPSVANKPKMLNVVMLSVVALREPIRSSTQAGSCLAYKH